MTPARFTVILLALPAVWLIVLFNRMIHRRNQVQEAWSGIDVQLRRRSNLVPNLVAAVQGYAAHEQQLLEDLTRLRGESLQRSDHAATAGVENDLSASLKSLLVLVEAYPALKADQNFRSLQRDLVAIEDELQLARRYYNGSVRDFNNLVESFPATVVAGALGFAPRAFFEIQRATERTAPTIDMTHPES